MAPAPGMGRDVVAGDHVYYQHPEHGLSSGEVLSTGRDGCNVRHGRGDGGHDPVPWASLLGHKLRKQRKFTVLERGEDGSICEDENGQRVFLRGDMPEAERPLGKSFSAPAPDHEAVRVLALEFGRSQLEQTHLIVGALDRLAAAMAQQAERLDQLIALQVAALNLHAESNHAPPPVQVDPAAQGTIVGAAPGSF